MHFSALLILVAALTAAGVAADEAIHHHQQEATGHRRHFGVAQRPPLTVGDKHKFLVPKADALFKPIDAVVATPRRGLYVSVLTGKIGKQVLTPSTTNILNDPVKLQQLFNTISYLGINTLSLYDLNTVIQANSADVPKLRSFVASARRAGVRAVEAIGAEYLPFWDRFISLYQNNVNTPVESRFDGMVTEIEFWAMGQNASVVVNTVKYIKAKAPAVPASGAPFYYSAYIGWTSQANVIAVANAVNYIFLHAYVKNPDGAFAYAQSRLTWVYQNTTAKAAVIFSEEGTTLRAGDEIFMGDWVKANSPTSLTKAEGLFTAAQNAVFAPAMTATRFIGFQNYEYFFLYEYMKTGFPVPLPAIRAPALQASIASAALTYVGTPYALGKAGDKVLRGAAGFPVDNKNFIWRAISQSVLPNATPATTLFTPTGATPAGFTKITCSATNRRAGDVNVFAQSEKVAVVHTDIKKVISTNSVWGAVAIKTFTDLGTASACFRKA